MTRCEQPIHVTQYLAALVDEAGELKVKITSDG